MPRYRHVLVAFDGSPEAELALAHAVAVAHHHRARLAIAGVVPRLAWPTRELETRLREAADGVPDDLSATAQVLEGDPARELLRLVREQAHDVIVVGARCAPDGIIGDADVPVIVVHSPNDGPDLAA